MDAPALRAPGGSVVDAAKEVPKPRTWHAVAEGFAALYAGPPVRDCVVGHESPGEAASRDVLVAGFGWRLGAAVRGCRDMSLKRRESAWGAAAQLRLGGRLGERSPVGRRNVARVGWEPIPVLVHPSSSPRSAVKPHERPPGVAERRLRHFLQPLHLWRAPSAKETDSLVRVC
jgi:hypothetical protein